MDDARFGSTAVRFARAGVLMAVILTFSVGVLWGLSSGLTTGIAMGALALVTNFFLLAAGRVDLKRERVRRVLLIMTILPSVIVLPASLTLGTLTTAALSTLTAIALAGVAIKLHPLMRARRGIVVLCVVGIVPALTIAAVPIGSLETSWGIIALGSLLAWSGIAYVEALSIGENGPQYNLLLVGVLPAFSVVLAALTGQPVATALVVLAWGTTWLFVRDRVAWLSAAIDDVRLPDLNYLEDQWRRLPDEASQESRRLLERSLGDRSVVLCDLAGVVHWSDPEMSLASFREGLSLVDGNTHAVWRRRAVVAIADQLHRLERYDEAREHLAEWPDVEYRCEACISVPE